MMRFWTSTHGLSLLVILGAMLFASHVRAQDAKVMTEPTAADFIRALTPPGAESDSGSRALAVGGTRSLSRSPSVNFKVQFEFGSDKLTEDAKLVLLELGAAIGSQDLAAYNFLIAGHTDAVGSAEYNLLLSERRARAVREYLTTAMNVSPARLQDVGWGEARPLDSIDPEGDVNRRVEITNIGGR